MKNIFKYIFLGLFALIGASCAMEQPIVFDHEQQAFDPQEGLILIEAIMPSETSADDQIYICGPFNGKETAEPGTAGSSLWQLEKSTKIEGKWGIYLDPTTFVSGKTLADGYWFYSVKDRREVTIQHNNAVHYLDASTGQSYNVYVKRWDSYYDAPAIELPKHDGTYRIYYICSAPWDPVNLYMYGDVNDLGGGWPGCEKIGSVELGGHVYSYFEVSTSEASGNTEHLIFNGNGGKKQIPSEQEPVVTFGSTVDFFYTIRENEDATSYICEAVADIENPGVEPYIPADPKISIYVSNLTGWDKLYAYSCNHASSPVEEAFGSWPGTEPKDTVDVSGTPYARFEISEDYADKVATLIFHNGDGVRAGGPVVTLEDGLKLALIEGGFAPVEDEEPYAVDIYVIDNSGFSDLAVYAWGDVEIFGGWPGAKPIDELTYKGVTYKRFEFLSTLIGSEENFIFSDNGNSQLPDLNLKLAEDLFIEVSSTGAQIIPKPEMPVNFYVNNTTGWDEIAVYAYGDSEVFGGWPGATPVGKTVYNDVEYTIFQFGDSNLGAEENFIFNNNNNGTQLGDVAVTLKKDMYFNVTATEATLIEKPAPITYVDMYVLDNTGWSDLAVYAWGDAEIFGGWPGKQAIENVMIEGITYKRFHFSDEYVGNAEHLIFNNNNGGTQLGDLDVTAAADMFIEITPSGAALIADPRSCCKIYVKDGSGWDALALYGWQTDEVEVFGGWPGAVPAGTVQMCGETWKIFKVGMDFEDKTYHIIFNNNGGGLQFDGPEVCFDKDHFFTITSSSCEEVDDPGYRLYVDDQTGWAEIAMYAWGDVELFGGWPGRVAEGTQVISGVTYKYFSYPSTELGKTIHPIVNNNNGGSQLDLAETKLEGDHYFTATL